MLNREGLLMKEVQKKKPIQTFERITSHWTWSFLGPALGMSLCIGMLAFTCRIMGQSFATTLDAIYGGFFGGIFIVLAIGWVLLTTVVSYRDHARSARDNHK